MPHPIILAVTGSIAAFKSARLASDLVSRGHDVRVVLTRGGARFVTPLTFEAITGNPVATDVWDEQPGTSRMGHIELARWGDVLAVAPASAHAIARLALGLADDMLGSVALSTAAPLVVAPAMETHMWNHPATRAHVATLQERGAAIVGPGSGRLASGAQGAGRMAEPETVAAAIERVLDGSQWAETAALAGRSVLVTAGPTYEPLDPVRFLGNRSSGKMGYAVAEEARRRGATVTLVAGPTALQDPAGISVLHVETHEQMRQAVVERAPSQDVLVMAAAISDFRPAQAAAEKLKRRDSLTLHLIPNSDIAAEAAAIAPHAVHVGFALETGGLVQAAQEKRGHKGQDIVVGNELSDAHNPFGSDTNRVVFVTAGGVEEIEETSKANVARELWDRIEPLLRGRDAERSSVSSG